MAFVNGNWRFKPVFLLTLGDPGGVVPLVGIKIGDDRAGFGAKLATEGVGIGFKREKNSVRAEDFVFVDRAFGDFGEEEFPDAGRATRAHGMDTAVPAIHIADDADARRGRRPYGEMCAGDTGDSVKVCAEFFVGVKMAAFADEVEIEVGEEKREGVRIENLEGFTVGAELNFVAAWLGGGRLVGRPDGFEEAFRTEFDAVGNFRRRHGRILEDDAGFGGPRNQETNRPAFRGGMRAEDAEGVGVGCGEEGIGADVEVGERVGGGGGRRGKGGLGIFGGEGGVGGESPWGAQAGVGILESGGNAVDGGIATNAMMGVVEPMMNGIGGDLFAIVYDAKANKLYGLNASGWAPKGLTIEFLQKQGLKEMPKSGVHTIDVPGAVDGWQKLADKFGRKKLFEDLP